MGQRERSSYVRAELVSTIYMGPGRFPRLRSPASTDRIAAWYCSSLREFAQQRLETTVVWHMPTTAF